MFGYFAGSLPQLLVQVQARSRCALVFLLPYKALILEANVAANRNRFAEGAPSVGNLLKGGLS